VKFFLSTVCLLVISCLTVSVVCPQLHASLFHSDQACPHGQNDKPCPSQGQNSSDQNPGVCAVVLYGEASEHTFTFLQRVTLALIDLGVSQIELKNIFASTRLGATSARGPPQAV
jgi:hypothetical protein